VGGVVVRERGEVQCWAARCGGKGQLQPIKAVHRAPMRNGLINRFPAGKIPLPRFLQGDNAAMKTNDENRGRVWGQAVNPSEIARRMVNFGALGPCLTTPSREADICRAPAHVCVAPQADICSSARPNTTEGA